ncbi:Uncharacterized protein involved in outer membrane biogenesis [Luteibacter sp. UNCMF331Sha3.1]|uniref:DUF748 domain-containing protein n=1 Tax=Luteibacter sp. UNCMF331Sha3.1 TaxID=1502760 RepID=UPI0008B0FE17|nr:DUF748 domain-containing protein [Luteibacter sp. UNCMF331Sha3.1]SEM20076.1 Uncharacterized protein involved in outer membrane biogenesis [Luteibacter sp. UNCMF331Sha3.1]
MESLKERGRAHWRAARARGVDVYRSRRARRIAAWTAGALAAFALLGFVVAPPLIRSQVEKHASAALGRPVTLGDVDFNPFTLDLVIAGLHIGERDGKTPFVDIDRVTANASWASLFRAAPILDALTLDRPRVHLRRDDAHRFNVSDILDRFASDPKAPPSEPARFALSNIAIHGGEIDFDDRVLDATHRVDHLELGIPFIANLPSATDIFVQPLLAMTIDGSPLRVQGQTKPFANSRESMVSFRLDKLDLPRYIGFVPGPLPVRLPEGRLSGHLDVRFLMTDTAPRVVLGGRVVVDDLRVHDAQDKPLLGVGHADIALTALEPLTSRYRFGAIALDRLDVRYARLPAGRSSIHALLPAPAAKPAPETKPADVRIDSLAVTSSRIEYADLAAPAPARLVLDDVRASLRGLSTVKAPVAAMDVTARMAGGDVATKGRLDLAASRYDGGITLKNVSLATLMPFAPSVLDADVQAGSIGAMGELLVDWHEAATVRIAHAKATLDGFRLVPHDGGVAPVTWRSLAADVALLDLATSEARLDRLTLDGLALDVRRLADGSVDLVGILKAAPPATAPQAPATSPWRWSIARVDVGDGVVSIRDAKAPARRRDIVLNATSFAIDGLSDDTRKPVRLNLDGMLGKGAFAIAGQVTPRSMLADLTIKATRLDLAPLQSLVTVPLNVRIASALLSVDGRLRASMPGKAPARIDWQGDATLGRLRVLDKVTDADFLRIGSLTASALSVKIGEATPRIDIGGIALDDFYARVIVNANGRLNLQDVVAGPETPGAVSVTEARTTPVPDANATPAPVAPSGPAADVRVGRVSLTKGRLNYTDNFIKPNYTADVTSLTGNIGAFGTAAGAAPAELTLQGQLDDNAPVDIRGTINPLTPVAFLDIAAKAEGIPLANLSPYSGKYAGYPITRGRLNVDVHYLLDQRKLTADNHIFIDQLTFGDRIEGPGITHLPVKLAVALLKDSEGRIDVRIPVSGSLDDPQFSVGGLVWRAIGNLIVKAVTSPFRLLASIGGGREDLGYIGFAPGSDVLDAGAQAKLADVVKVLNDKPSISLDIVGRIDPAMDDAGLRRVMVDDLVRQEQVNDKGDDPAPPTDDEREKYLERAYRHASFPKAKNLIGLTRSQPADEMRRLMETNMPVDADALRHLAERRANAVRQWLQGKVDDKRVFVVAPKVDAKGIDDGGPTTRVDFGLH